MKEIRRTCPAQNAPISVLRSFSGIKSSLFPGNASNPRNATADSIPAMINTNTTGCPHDMEFCKSTAAKSDAVAIARVTAPGKSKARSAGISSLSGSCRCSSSPSWLGKSALAPSAISKPQAIATGTCPRNSLQQY